MVGPVIVSFYLVIGETGGFVPWTEVQLTIQQRHLEMKEAQ